MSAYPSPPASFARDVVLIGAGGVGAPAALTLVEAGVEQLTLVDDDHVERSNLHRQILFREEDIGRRKVDVLAEALCRRRPGLRVELLAERALPDTIARVVSGARVVIDGTDNFASRFLFADACHAQRVPLIHAAAVRFVATVMTTSGLGQPCYRCLFEDPPETAPDCATAGVAGPVCGVAGAIAADRALRVLARDASVFGTIVTFDGERDVLREVRVSSRADCALCAANLAVPSAASPAVREPQHVR